MQVQDQNQLRSIVYTEANGSVFCRAVEDMQVSDKSPVQLGSAALQDDAILNPIQRWRAAEAAKASKAAAKPQSAAAGPSSAMDKAKVCRHVDRSACFYLQWLHQTGYSSIYIAVNAVAGLA